MSTSAPPADDVGLRARKLRETRDTIHREAVRLALAEGPDAVTVAEISAAANVSSRTFFNYFPTKDDAILGFHTELPSDDELAAFESARGDDLLWEVVLLMNGVFSGSGDAELAGARRTLIQQHPALIQRQMSRIYAVEQRIAVVAAKRMHEHPQFSTVPDVAASSRMLVILATSIVRFSVREAVHHAGSRQKPADELRSAYETFTRVAGLTL